MDYKKLQAYFFLSILLFVLIMNVAVFLPYVYALIMAVIFAVILHPVYNKMLKMPVFKKLPSISSALLVILLIIVILLPIVFLGFLLVKEATVAYASIVENDNSYVIVERAQMYITDNFPNTSYNLSENFNTYANKLLTYLIESVGPVFTNILGMIFSFFIMLFALYYLLKDGKKFKKALILFSPLSDKYDKQIIKKLSIAVNSVVKGTLLIAIIQGLLAGIGFFIFGVPNPVLLGFVTVIMALIPALGTAVVVIPAVIFLYFTGNPFAALGLLIWGTLLVGLIDNFLRPKMIEKDIKIHPLLILLSALGGLVIFGAFGFFLGPLLLSLLFALLDIYKEEFHEYISLSK